MTDNEKRSHDIAMLWIKEVLEGKVTSLIDENCQRTGLSRNICLLTLKLLRT